MDIQHDTDMQNEYRHAAWSWTCTMVMDMQHGHGYAPLTFTCTKDMDMHHEHGHAPWSWTCIMDMDMHHEHGHAPWTWTWTLTILSGEMTTAKKTLFVKNKFSPMLLFWEVIFQKPFFLKLYETNLTLFSRSKTMQNKLSHANLFIK
jgi:hypothetical protein